MPFKTNKKQRSLGNCLFCGSPIYENAYGWKCSNSACKSVIYKDDKFFQQIIQKPVSKSKAITLMTGGSLTFKDVVVNKEIGKCDIRVTLGEDESGRFSNRYKISYLDKEKKKWVSNLEIDNNSACVTGFDILNGD